VTLHNSTRNSTTIVCTTRVWRPVSSWCLKSASCMPDIQTHQARLRPPNSSFRSHHQLMQSLPTDPCHAAQLACYVVLGKATLSQKWKDERCPCPVCTACSLAAVVLLLCQSLPMHPPQRITNSYCCFTSPSVNGQSQLQLEWTSAVEQVRSGPGKAQRAAASLVEYTPATISRAAWICLKCS